VKKETSGVRIRYRIKFEKGEKLRFIGHLDTARLIIMAIRKSNLPVLYTKGFKPKPRLSFSPPLPLLLTSKSEFIDIWMERIPKGNVLETIQKNLPSGIKLLKSSIISLKEKSLSETAIFERVSVFNVGIEEKQIQEFMKRDIIPVVKRDKEFDIRKSIIDMKKEDNDLIILKKISKVKIFWILENLLKISPEDSLKLKIEREELLKLDGKKLDFS
jgi:radical SAM-linked protein